MTHYAPVPGTAISIECSDRAAADRTARILKAMSLSFKPKAIRSLTHASAAEVSRARGAAISTLRRSGLTIPGWLKVEVA